MRTSNLRGTWDRFVRYAYDFNGHYPHRLKEVFNPKAAQLCALLRVKTMELVEDHPHLDPDDIRSLLNQPTWSFRLDGKSPYQAILDNPELTIYDRALAATRNGVRDLEQKQSAPALAIAK